MPNQPMLPRRFPRIPSENALLVKKVGDEASESLAKTRVLGGGGCMFAHEASLGVGSVVELLISLPSRVLKARARVVYENAAKPGGVEVGVEFLDVSAEDRLALDALLAATPAASRR
ncbi:MAG: PilZ domain-containing protein [Thermoanaerobaculales bacterium]